MLFASTEEQRAAIARARPRVFPDFTTGGDFFRRRISAHLHPGVTVLDAGSGRGGIITEFRTQITRLVGVDCDQTALASNAALDEPIVADLASVPLPDASVDLITAEFVVEHLAEPTAVLRELQRIVRPGGALIFLTSNRHHPLMALSRLTPTGFHRWAKRRLLHKSETVYPALYRLNTPTQIRRAAAAGGWNVAGLQLAGNPEYLSVTPWLVTPALRLERWLANRYPERQMYIIAELRKS